MAGAGLSRSAKKSGELQRILHREAELAQTKKINKILKLAESERSEEQKSILENAPEVVHLLQERARVREKQKQRCIEKEDSPELLQSKCEQLAEAIRQSSYTVVYTGAGISTAASIPDYRGPNGIWTLLSKGETPKAVELSDAEPTYTHMCIAKLHTEGLIKHVVSQNCDGLHMRSGLPRSALSELHGNMYLELCKTCTPPVEHIRLFDVTQRTGLRKHRTGRKCTKCRRGELQDSIVHFGEKGPLHSPYNWKQAARAADEAQLVICLGTSLKVLRRYACLWSMHKPPHERPKLFVVNLMWTPKDDLATLKINGKCDDALNRVMTCLNLTPKPYTKLLDPVFTYAIPLSKRESNSHDTKLLTEPSGYNKATICTMLSDVIAKQPPVEATETDEESNPRGVSDNEEVESEEVEQLVPVPVKTTIKKTAKTVVPVATRRHNTRKRKLSAKVLEAMDDLNGTSEFLDEETPVNGKSAGKPLPTKLRKTSSVAMAKTGNESKRRGRPAKRGGKLKRGGTRNSVVKKAEVENGVDDNGDVKDMELDEQKEFDKEFQSQLLGVESTPQVNDKPEDKPTVKRARKSPSRSRVALTNGHNGSSDQNIKANGEPLKSEDTKEQNLVKPDKGVVETDVKDISDTVLDSKDQESKEDTSTETEEVSLNAETGVLTQSTADGLSVVIEPVRPEPLSIVTSTPQGEPSPATSSASDGKTNATTPLSTSSLSSQQTPPIVSPTAGPLSPPIAGGSKKKTLNNLLEKIQARRTETGSSDAQAPLYTHMKLTPDPSASLSKSPKKIKDYLAQSESRNSATSPAVSVPAADTAPPPQAPPQQPPKPSPPSAMSDNTSSSTTLSNGRIICVNGCEGYEPGEVHSHSPNHVPTAMDNSVLGIPNLDIQQVWAATYSACFMASYQALQSKVLQSPNTTTQFTQADLMNLTADVTFQSQLLAQFQQNLLRSMAGVVSPEKQAHVLAQTQQVLMQNIAAMQTSNSSQPKISPAVAQKVQQALAPVAAAPPTVTSAVDEAPAKTVNPLAAGTSGVALPQLMAQITPTVVIADPGSMASPASSSSGSEMAAGTSAKSLSLPSPSTSPLPTMAGVNTNSPRQSAMGTSSMALNGNQFMVSQSPSTSPSPSASTSPRLVNKVARGVCGPRIKHKKKWWEVEPSDEVSNIVNHHLNNIRKAAQERTVVRQELERRTQSLPNEVACNAPQRCKRRSVEELASIAIAAGNTSGPEGITAAQAQMQREAALRALIAAQQQESAPNPGSTAGTSTSAGQVVDLTHLTSAEQALVGFSASSNSSISSHVVTIEPEAPEEEEEADPLALDCSQAVAVLAGEGEGEQPASAPPAIIPGWFGKGWRANKRVGRRKKSR